MKVHFLITTILLTGLLLGGCSTTVDNKFTYFNKKPDFNIAQISVNKIVIIGLIDDTKSLSAQQKQQATTIIFDTFANYVDSDSLIDTETLALQIGVQNYQTIYKAAQLEEIAQLVNLAQQHNTGQYLLISRLTKNTDHGAKAPLNGFLNDCNHYGRSISLQMKLIDSNNGSEIWGGQLNKNGKKNNCNDDDDKWRISHQEQDDKQALAWLMTLLVISAISDNSNEDLASNSFNTIFSQAVNEFAQELPSFYH
jgi:hypothetical protein